MSDYTIEYRKFIEDKRIPCQFGKKCYQKNPLHHKKYKHPPKQSLERFVKECESDTLDLPANKKPKLDIESINNRNNDLKLIVQTTNLDTKINNENVPTSSHLNNDNMTNIKIKQLNSLTNNNSKKVNLTKEECEHFIKEKFLVEMSDDFFQFWDFCKELNSDSPCEALKVFELELVGPFDVLAGNFIEDKEDYEYLIHWRYFHDPPEVQTVIKGSDTNGFHIAYFRDSPQDIPNLVVYNNNNKDGVFHEIGDNLFAGLFNYLLDLEKNCDPFKKTEIKKFLSLIRTKAEQHNLNLSLNSKKVKSRQKKIVTKTFNKIGVVVPYDKKTELGYRNLNLSDKQFNKILDNLQKALPEQKQKFLSNLQPFLTNVTIALDECDFGTGIELGWNIIAHDIDSLNDTALRYLKNSYSFLNREDFSKIAEAHLKHRKKGCNLSIL